MHATILANKKLLISFEKEEDLKKVRRLTSLGEKRLYTSRKNFRTFKKLWC